MTDVVTARDSPRIAAAGLLQALVDARALAYAARNPVLLDLVYAPGATKAGADRANLATALENGATYLGLAFVVKDAAFLAGTSTTARIRATIVTPAYSGRHARAARTSFLAELAAAGEPRPFPLQRAVIADLAGVDGYGFYLGGTGAPRARELPVDELVRTLVAETEAA